MAAIMNKQEYNTTLRCNNSSALLDAVKYCNYPVHIISSTEVGFDDDLDGNIRNYFCDTLPYYDGVTCNDFEFDYFDWLANGSSPVQFRGGTNINFKITIMAIRQDQKNKINNIIYERAYEIETKLSENDFFLAKLAGVKPSDVSNVSLKVAIKELKKEMNKNN